MSIAAFDAKLLAFAEGLGLSEDYIKKGNLALRKVIETLKTQQSHCEIARVCISGSIGKHTSLKDSDFDSILFINYIRPRNYRDVLKYSERILKDRLTSLQISRMRVAGKYSLQFVLEDKYEIDLLVAANYATSDVESHGVFHSQQIETLRQIAKNPSDYYDYSSSLAESQRQFMAKQDSFTHSLVRLCKFWLKKLEVGFYRSGVKSCIELIAVFSAQQRSDNSISNTFKIFLENVKEIDSLQIHFRETDGRINTDVNNIPWNIRQMGHFIMDPANPYNDISLDIEQEFSTKIKKYADIVILNFDKWPNYNSSIEAFLLVCAMQVKLT